MDVDKIFFSSTGLTSTSANHVANLAKECVQDVEFELNSIELIDSDVTLIGSSERNVLKTGWKNDDVQGIEQKLINVANAKSLIAWLREAIKARQSMLDKINGMTLAEWAAIWEEEVPQTPKFRKTLTKDDVVAGFSIKKRNLMYSLETKASVIGKYIHPDGYFAKARKEYMKRLNSKHNVDGKGRDTLLYTYTPSCNSDVLEEAYFNLQNLHRTTQAELNGILHEIDILVQEDEIAANAEYTQALSTYKREMSELESRFKEYKIKEAKRIGDLKIAIPNDLKEIYDYINSLGKNKA